MRSPSSSRPHSRGACFSRSRYPPSLAGSRLYGGTMSDAAPSPDDSRPPVITIGEPVEEAARLLRSLQALLLMHPFAARAAIRVLVAEGRAFAETQEGR